jgi:hypothetical protein
MASTEQPIEDGEQYESAPATLESLVQYEDPVRFLI